MQLNPDVLNVIKEYVFHERKTIYKAKKIIMIKEINSANTCFSWNIEDHFIFCSELITSKSQFQVKFCVICGKYNLNINDNYVKYCYDILPYSDRLLCHHFIEDPFIV